jgi:hypothetical protein
MNFAEEKSDQFSSILKAQQDYCKVIEVDVVNRDDVAKDGDEWPQLELDWDGDEKIGDWDLFEKDDSFDNEYLAEKRKGGLNSHQRNHSLLKKTGELCREELQKKKPPTSALQLCKIVARRIEAEFPNLLSDFEPYRKVKKDGGDWTKPTFYDWCNDVFKEARTK